MDDGTILVVDSEDTIRQLLELILTEKGYRCLLASNASAAIEIVRSTQIDLALLEWTLPDMEGTELCHIIKQNYNNTFVPVIMLTARAQRTDIIQGLDLGANDYLVKPFDVEEVLARIRAMLRIRLQDFGRVQRNTPEAHAVEMRFDFPTTVEVPCKQYLLYFIDFLRDVGIDAIAQLKEDAGQVLFSVRPKNKDEALDNIREALEIYLQLPIRQVVPAMPPETSIEVQRLGSQVLHLQSQIMLGNALAQQQQLTLQQKDVVIAQQQAIIQQQLLTGQVLVQSLQRETEENDVELVAGKLVRIKRWNPENIPVDLDLPGVIRYLKEKFRRKELP